LLLLLFVVALFAGMSLLIYLNCRLLRLNREDLIAAYFCSVKKTLAMEYPLAMLIFGKRSDLSLILLPIHVLPPTPAFREWPLSELLVQARDGISAGKGEQKPGTPISKVGAITRSLASYRILSQRYRNASAHG